MSPEQNKVVVREAFRALDAHDLETLLGKRLADDYQLQFNSMPLMDKNAAAGSFGAFLSAFPDIAHTIEEMIAEGDRVGCRLVVTGTHQADLMGIPPTGRRIEIRSINIFRLRDGLIVDQRINSDGMGMLQQLGVIPAGATA